ncbi:MULTISPECIES: type II toxin-antitoxin system HicB family antitoxin [unclassified Kribbella]|uniref:type II toxin-antitoxin system HicB family antitoxin n=1 Tax=unclassified Kribbella TaxID=2644121 RepID=UPI0030194E54
MKREVHVPYTVEQDETGAWSAAAAVTPDAFANGEGDTREEAIEDLREAVAFLLEEVGVPEELVVTIELD